MLNSPSFFQIGAVEVGVLGDGAEGVGPLIAKGGGIRLCADAEAVQNDQKTRFSITLSLRFYHFALIFVPSGQK